MDFAHLTHDDFDPWAVPLTPAAIAELTRIEEQLDHYRSRLNDNIQQMHTLRLQTREEAGLPSTRSIYTPQFDPRAGCRFEGFARNGDLLYSGQIWFRGECDSFGKEDCDPLPGHLLGLGQDEIRVFFSEEAARLRMAEEERSRAAEEECRAADELRDRETYLRLQAKFGSV